ncbi:serine/threonine protein kinase [Evansella caseinilytica]|uniref:Serine/threonine-protein kinase PrkC n=1 Tax=Evansella caseinilytica TaxID=1503961 RepID=A0A1H3MC80_9BACI|nr:Stk1 family PASTA domain-containing Ser/Thr kinase [Evansella caseinilytica]SDY74183.1 serine/threonine protein kinase [Evansella caseinilytica]
MNGKRINDRYELLKPVGGGGMANVYLARDMILDREVAVKVLKPQFSEDEEFIKRFRREAQAATSLSHPNVVNIYDVGEEDNLYYIVMEYVKGNTLKDYIQKHGKLDVQEAVHIMTQITSAIEHAHENHIIHRDIKSHNILIGLDGQAKVTDFGIARAISDATITHTNSVLGSVHYLSPEQARGGHVTYKSDIYSLGIVMYEMLTGEVPFNGDTAVSVAIKHLQDPLPFLKDKDPSVPQSVENVILKATSKNPDGRYRTADEMTTDLMTVLDADRRDEERIAVPLQDEEATKAVPLISQTIDSDDDQTLVHHHGKKTNKPVKQKKEKPAKKKKGMKFWITIALLSLLFLIATMYVAFSMIPRWLHVDEVTIPDNIVGMELEEAEKELTGLGLVVDHEFRHDDDIEEGVVISHTPRAGETVKVGSDIKLIVSEGSEPTAMLELIGKSRQDAERMLEDFDDYDFEYEETADYDNDTVIQQSPEPGELIIPKETVVTLTLSQRPTYTMANLYGMSREEVINAFANNELVELDFSEQYHATIDEGKVISQNPSMGSEIKERTTVKVVISSGPEPVEQEPEEEPITADVPFLFQVKGNDSNNGEAATFRVRISVIDMMHSTPKQVIDEEISADKRFYIPMTVAPGNSGYLLVYVNGEEYKDSPYEYTYEEMKQYQ